MAYRIDFELLFVSMNFQNYIEGEFFHTFYGHFVYSGCKEYGSRMYIYKCHLSSFTVQLIINMVIHVNMWYSMC